MSWESITSRDLLSIPHGHNLSVTHLLPSPDCNRYPLNLSRTNICQFDDNYSRLAGHGSSPERGNSIWQRNGLSRSRNSALDCFVSCQRSIKQYLARRKIELGLRLYEQHNQTAAVRTWRSALKATQKHEDRFQLLGYLYQAHMDWGKYRESIEFGHRQLGISEELDSPQMRAEAYLNLARSHEHLGGLERALSYARHSLYNECGTKCRTGGMVHLTVAQVYLEMGGFSRALQGLHGAHKTAIAIGDPSLELQVYVALSELFGRLQDNKKSARYASKAYDLSRSLQLGDLNSSHHRAALLRMAAALRKQGELGDAQDYCTEATRLALISGDQATYTRSIRIMGDILRKKNDIDRAFRQYELAMGTAAAIGDRMAQMEAMDGAARCLEQLRTQQKICNCRPLEFNTRLLEVASSIGAKLLVRKIRSRLALIYRALGDEEQYKTHTRLAFQTELALGLNCGECGEVFGITPDSLEALPCAHILHARCAHKILRKRGDKLQTPQTCPACNKLVNSRTQLDDQQETNSFPPPPNSGLFAQYESDTDPTQFLNLSEIDCNFSLNDNLNNNILKKNQTINYKYPLNGNAGNSIKGNKMNLTNNNNFDTLKKIDSTIGNNSVHSPQNTSNKSNSPEIYRSNLSLASLSLRASSLTIDSECHLTSSV